MFSSFIQVFEFWSPLENEVPKSYNSSIFVYCFYAIQQWQSKGGRIQGRACSHNLSNVVKPWVLQNELRILRSFMSPHIEPFSFIHWRPQKWLAWSKSALCFWFTSSLKRLCLCFHLQLNTIHMNVELLNLISACISFQKQGHSGNMFFN